MVWRATALAAAVILASLAVLDRPAAQPAAPPAADALAIETVIEQLRPAETGAEETGEDEGRVALSPSARPAPGEEVIYTVAFTNVGTQPVHDVRISSAIPAQLSYVEGTAFAPGARVFYSVDGGLRYAPPDELVVRDELGAAHPARVANYTHIRWIFEFPLEPGARGAARFRAVVLDPV